MKHVGKCQILVMTGATIKYLTDFIMIPGP